MPWRNIRMKALMQRAPWFQPDVVRARLMPLLYEIARKSTHSQDMLRKFEAGETSVLPDVQEYILALRNLIHEMRDEDPLIMQESLGRFTSGADEIEYYFFYHDDWEEIL